MTESVKLEPCPFCGGAAELRDYDPREPYEPFGIIVDHAADCFLSLFTDPETVAAAWNQRHQPQEREAVVGLDAAAKRFQYEHRNACYPDATEFEAREAAEQIVRAALTTPAPAVSTDEIVEPLARAAADDPEARRIAAKCGTVCFDDMDAETQEFWRCIARAVLSRLRGEG